MTEDELTIEDYKECFEDHKRLVREIDVIINGDGAAKQASLCDIVSDIKALVDYIPCNIEFLRLIVSP